MNGFINNILRRHTETIAGIMPRLPGKFEPVNFPVTNSGEDISAGTEASQLFDPVGRIAEPGVENKNAVNIDAGTSITASNSRKAAHQIFKPLNDATRPESTNTHETTINKNIRPVNNDAGEKINIENISVGERSTANEIKPGNRVEGKNRIENFDEAEQTGKILANHQSVRSNNTEKNENEQDLSFNQDIIKPASAKRDSTLEDLKSPQAGTIKPAMPNLNAATNFNNSPVVREQTMSSVIKVSIGRIEVRAVTSAAPIKTNRPVLQKPRLSLDEYLKNRNGA